jgi:acetyl esterase/lipase
VFIEDAAAAIAWTLKHIAEFGGDPKRVFVSGHSAGAYLTLMCGLDRKWLAAHEVEADELAGLIPLSPQVITHFTVRKERGIDEKQPVVDELAPLFHVRKDTPPILLITGDREKELMGRYEECAYFWRMMKLTGHAAVTLHEMDGFDHGKMPEPSFPLLLKFVEDREGGKARD